MRYKKKSNLRVGIYARRTVDSDKSDSIQMQIETCRKHLELTHPDDIESITIYQDEGFTRRNTDRPDWQRMMSDAEAGLLDVIVAYKIDRISGNMRDFALFYTRIVDDLELQLISVREGIDSSLPLVGEVMAFISAMLASYEVKQDSVRSYDNSRNLTIHGFWSGGSPPIGYSLLPVTVGGKNHKILDIVPDDVAYKKELIAIFLDNNFSLTTMETYLKNANIKTRRGNFFSTTQLYSILTSPQCVEATPEMYDYFAGLGCEMEQEYSSREKWDGTRGILIFGRTTEQKGKHANNPPEDWLVCLGQHKPFLKADTYLQIREQMKSHEFVRSAKHPPELLKGILRCKCGRLMQVAHKTNTAGKSVSWYYCIRRMRQGVQYCEVGHTKAEILDERVLDIFRAIQADPAAIDKYLTINQASPSGLSADSLRAKERAIRQKLGNLTSTLALNSDSVAAKYIIAEMERLDAELAECKRNVYLAMSEERKLAAAKKSALAKRNEICRFIENFDSFSPAEKNTIAQNVLKECVWDGETLKITL